MYSHTPKELMLLAATEMINGVNVEVFIIVNSAHPMLPWFNEAL